ncbi:MAG: DUF2764 family protein [Chitinispirillaceae bacterium]|nr:DUF2764 family protein [Chitinispirillaceae bacterium]
MSGNYYYFVAGLPDLLLDEGKQTAACVEFAAEAQEQLSPGDFGFFNLLRLPFDNDNLVKLVEKKEHVADRRGCIDEAELAAGIKSPDALPGYMQRFLEAFRENRPPHPGLTVADQLSWFFYEEMAQRENAFIRDWYAFDLQLRNVAAAINCRRSLAHLDALSTDRDKAASALLIGRDDVAEAILRSNAPDFGLAAQLPWIERLLGLSRGKPLDFEKGIDTLRWDTLNEMTVATYFQAETVYAFYIKLIIVERWRALDPKSGKERLDRLLDELKASYTVPELF